MARTQEQILRQINEEADRHVELAELQRNRSRVSVWGYVKQVVAFAIRTLEELFDTHRAEVQALIEQQQIGSLLWYKEQALRWQKGDQLALVDGSPAYLKNHPDARILRHVAVSEDTETGTISVQAVKAGDAPGAPYTPLTEVEQQAFQAYLNAITFAGLRATASSEAAVAVRIDAKVQVDAQLITTSGTAIGSTQKPVEEALKSYLRDLPFNGVVRRTAIVDAIQAVPGVIDVRITALQGADSAFVATYLPASGHAILDEASTLTYQTDLITSD